MSEDKSSHHVVIVLIALSLILMLIVAAVVYTTYVCKILYCKRANYASHKSSDTFVGV
jgi:hypothetical protein